MSEIPEHIVEGIKYILEKSKEKIERPIRHDFIQNSLLLFFQDCDFHVIQECEIEYRGLFRNKRRFKEPLYRKRGRIDLFAYNDILKIAIEYDSGATLKWRSIEKLLQCDAEHCMGMISGSHKDKAMLKDFYIKKNLWKIQQVFKELIMYYNLNKEYNNIYKLLNKKFWLRIGSANYFKQYKLIDLFNIELDLYTTPKIEKIDETSKKLQLDRRNEVVYVLKLGNKKWWVGKTRNHAKKIESYKRGKGNEWIRTNGFLCEVEMIEDGDLVEKTLEYMKKYGWENVKGTYWHDGPQIYIPKKIKEYVKEQMQNLGEKKYVQEIFNESIEAKKEAEKVKKIAKVKESTNKEHLIYVLKLENNKWYVGKTTNIMRRLEEHKRGERTPWTIINKIIKIEDLIEGGDWKEITLDYMRKYGWENVRGYAWSQWNLKNPPKELR